MLFKVYDFKNFIFSQLKFRNKQKHLNDELLYNHTVFLRNKFPEIENLKLELTLENATILLDFYESILSSFYPEYKQVHLRNQLIQLSARLPEQKNQIQRLIAISNLSEGIPDRARILNSDPEFKSLLNLEIDKSEIAYGCDFIRRSNPNGERGISLKFYVEKNLTKFYGRKILHISPEKYFDVYLAEISDYYQLNGFNQKYRQIIGDLTNLDSEIGDFDFIFMHRVLEHILDDESALLNLNKLLAPGGTLNFSVPASFHLLQDIEFIIRDKSHHDHVRHYSSMISDKVSKYFSSISRNDFLTKPENLLKLSEINGIPLVFFEAKKAEK